MVLGLEIGLGYITGIGSYSIENNKVYVLGLEIGFGSIGINNMGYGLGLDIGLGY